MAVRFGLAVAAIAALGGCATMDGGNDPALAVARAYCAAVMANDEPRTEMLMSDALRASVARARAASSAFEVANPGDKPPLGDGLPLAAYPDVPAKCTSGRLQGSGIILTYGFADSSPGWKDKLVIERTASGAAVADVLFAPDFRHGLRETLEQIANDPG